MKCLISYQFVPLSNYHASHILFIPNKNLVHSPSSCIFFLLQGIFTFKPINKCLCKNWNILFLFILKQLSNQYAMTHQISDPKVFTPFECLDHIKSQMSIPDKLCIIICEWFGFHYLLLTKYDIKLNKIIIFNENEDYMPKNIWR